MEMSIMQSRSKDGMKLEIDTNNEEMIEAITQLIEKMAEHKESITDLAKKIGKCCENHGFRDNELRPTDFAALIHSEVSEMLEEFRAGHEATETYFRTDGKPEGVPSELADIIIRCLDMADYYGIDIEKAIYEKYAFNLTRPYLHGKAF